MSNSILTKININGLTLEFPTNEFQCFSPIKQTTIIDDYNNAYAESSFKSSEYLATLKGLKIAWTAKLVDIFPSADKWKLPILIFESNSLILKVVDIKKEYISIKRNDMVLIIGKVISVVYKEQESRNFLEFSIDSFNFPEDEDSHLSILVL